MRTSFYKVAIPADFSLDYDRLLESVGQERAVCPVQYRPQERHRAAVIHPSLPGKAHVGTTLHYMMHAAVAYIKIYF
jgi:hypothetical protein